VPGTCDGTLVGTFLVQLGTAGGIFLAPYSAIQSVAGGRLNAANALGYVLADFHFADFSDSNGLQLVGTASIITDHELRLTPVSPTIPSVPIATAASPGGTDNYR
jgi:hypothetical protein